MTSATYNKGSRLSSLSSTGREQGVVWLSLSIFLVLNCLTSPKYPLPWQDENVFADIAVNFATGRGFISSVCMCGEPSLHSFFSCNMPLFPFLLGGWVKLFGFSILAVRSFNYLLFSLAIIVLWQTVRRLNLISSPQGRVLLVWLLMMGYGMGFIYRSARYDCLTLLLASLILFATSMPSLPFRLGLVTVLGVFFPMAGLQLVCYSVVMSALALLLFRWRYLREIIALSLGIVVGGILILALFSHYHVLQNFLIQLPMERQKRFAHFSKEPSFILLLITCAILVLRQIWKRVYRLRSASSLGVAFGLSIPLGMVILGKFPIYYSWMAYIPLAIATSAALNDQKATLSRATRFVCALLIFFACLFGAPIQLASAIYYWHDRDTDSAAALIRQNLSPNDWVYTDYSSYFAVRSVTPHVFMPYVIADKFKPAINVLVVSPADFESYAHSLMGGEWHDTGQSITPTRKAPFPHSAFAILLQRTIDFHIYRRIDSTTEHIGN